MRLPSARLASALLTSLLLVACGDKDDDDPAGSTDDTGEPASDDGGDEGTDDGGDEGSDDGGDEGSDDGSEPVDADGDGSPADEDCDDDDPDAWPGNTETWYDGVDGDCDGASDYDQDGDGHDDPSGGGDDCDDTDAAVHVGADERVDGVDSDCDGEDDHWDLDGSYAGFELAGTYDGGWLGMDLVVADLDGDGLADLAATQPEDAWSYSSSGALHIFDGATLSDPTAPTLADFDARVLGDATTYGYYSGMLQVHLVQSLDGTGLPTLAVSAPYADDKLGAVFLITATELAAVKAGTAATEDLSTAAGTVLWDDDDDVDAYGMSVADVGDRNGDGDEELMLTALDPSEELGWLCTVTGADLALGGDLTVSDSAGCDAWSTEEWVTVHGPGDLDGDGYPEVLVGDPDNNGVYLHWGALSGDGHDGMYDTADTTSFGSGGPLDRPGMVVRSGDVNGDGTADLVIGGGGLRGDDRGVVWVYDGASAARGSTYDLRTDAYVTYSGVSPMSQSYVPVRDIQVADLDGDGLDDLFIGGDATLIGGFGHEGNASVVLSGDTGTVDLENVAAASWTGLTPADADHVGAALGLGDVDGDGSTDFVFSAASHCGAGDSPHHAGSILVAWGGF